MQGNTLKVPQILLQFLYHITVAIQKLKKWASMAKSQARERLNEKAGNCWKSWKGAENEHKHVNLITKKQEILVNCHAWSLWESCCVFCMIPGTLITIYFIRNAGQLTTGTLNKAVLEPRVSPAFAITYFCNHCNIRFENTSKYVDTLTLFNKNLNQRSLTPRWPLTPWLLKSHVWLYPRIILSKSHDNTSMYVDTVIKFAKYHIHTHTYILHTTYRMSDHIVSYWTQFRRDKKL